MHVDVFMCMFFVCFPSAYVCMCVGILILILILCRPMLQVVLNGESPLYIELTAYDNFIKFLQTQGFVHLVSLRNGRKCHILA